MTARPAPDSRAEQGSIADADIRTIITRIEGIGLLVLDPKSDELVERIARALSRKFAGQQLDLPHDEYVDRYWPSSVDMARAVLAALAAPGGEG